MQAAAACISPHKQQKRRSCCSLAGRFQQRGLFIMVNGIGVLANLASVLLSISPLQDVRDIHQTQCVTERSILPYCMMMIDGASWVLLAAMIDDGSSIGMINGFGFLAGCAYSFVYLRNSRLDKGGHVHREAWRIFLGTLAVIALMASAGVALEHKWSRHSAVDHIIFVVYVFDVMLYASPLALLWKVLHTGSTSGMYLPLSLSITAAAILRAAYAYQISAWFFAVPQCIGFLAGVAQLSLFLRFGVANNNEPNEADPLIAGTASSWPS